MGQHKYYSCTCKYLFHIILESNAVYAMKTEMAKENMAFHTGNVPLLKRPLEVILRPAETAFTICVFTCLCALFAHGALRDVLCAYANDESFEGVCSVNKRNYVLFFFAVLHILVIRARKKCVSKLQWPFIAITPFVSALFFLISLQVLLNSNNGQEPDINLPLENESFKESQFSKALLVWFQTSWISTLLTTVLVASQFIHTILSGLLLVVFGTEFFKTVYQIHEKKMNDILENKQMHRGTKDRIIGVKVIRDGNCRYISNENGQIVQDETSDGLLVILDLTETI